MGNVVAGFMWHDDYSFFCLIKGTNAEWASCMCGLDWKKNPNTCSFKALRKTSFFFLYKNFVKFYSAFSISYTTLHLYGLLLYGTGHLIKCIFKSIICLSPPLPQGASTRCNHPYHPWLRSMCHASSIRIYYLWCFHQNWLLEWYSSSLSWLKLPLTFNKLPRSAVLVSKDTRGTRSLRRSLQRLSQSSHRSK